MELDTSRVQDALDELVDVNVESRNAPVRPPVRARRRHIDVPGLPHQPKGRRKKERRKRGGRGKKEGRRGKMGDNKGKSHQSACPSTSPLVLRWWLQP